MRLLHAGCRMHVSLHFLGTALFLNPIIDSWLPAHALRPHSTKPAPQCLVPSKYVRAAQHWLLRLSGGSARQATASQCFSSRFRKDVTVLSRNAGATMTSYAMRRLACLRVWLYFSSVAKPRPGCTVLTGQCYLALAYWCSASGSALPCFLALKRYATGLQVSCCVTHRAQ